MQQRNSDIIDVCAGRSGVDQSAHRLESVIGVNVLLRIECGDPALYRA